MSTPAFAFPPPYVRAFRVFRGSKYGFVARFGAIRRTLQRLFISRRDAYLIMVKAEGGHPAASSER
jgi:hypothetical protein